MRRLVLSTAVACFAVTPLSSQPQPARRVTLSVVALDSAGQPTLNLTASDFELRDEGHAAPLTLAPAARPLLAVRPGEKANQPTPAAASTLIVFDLLNQEVTARPYAQAALIRGLRALPSAASVSLSIVTAAGALLPLGNLSPDAADDAITKSASLRHADIDIAERARRTFSLLEQAGRSLAGARGRKSVVWITHGVPLSLASQSGVTEPMDFTATIRRLATTFERMGISVYPVQQTPAGIETGGVGSEDMLRTFASLTGGELKFSGDIDAALRQTLDDARAAYVLSYTPAPNNWDGKFHRLQLRSAKKGVRLRYPAGYLAAPLRTDEEAALLRNALRSPDQLPEIGLFAAADGAAPGTLRVRLRIDANALQFTESAGHWIAKLDLEGATVNRDGDVEPAAVRSIQLSLTPDQLAATRAAGIPLTHDVPAAKGAAQVRLAVFDPASSALGTITLPLPM